jgi:hypothetical protein
MNENQECIICLEKAEENSYSLAEKFGCECKSIIHEKCLTSWIMSKYNETGAKTTECFQCREKVYLGEIERVFEPVIIRNRDVIVNNINVLPRTRTFVIIILLSILFASVLWLSRNIK